MDLTKGTKSRHQRRVCGHCNDLLSYSAYHSHRALYYVESEQRWLGACSDNDNFCLGGSLTDSANVSDNAMMDCNTDSIASPDHSGNV